MQTLQKTQAALMAVTYIEGTYLGVCLQCSLQHSLLPNANYVWSDKDKNMPF